MPIGRTLPPVRSSPAHLPVPRAEVPPRLARRAPMSVPRRRRAHLYIIFDRRCRLLYTDGRRRPTLGPARGRVCSGRHAFVRRLIVAWCTR
jgi:hypothetical protein